MIMCILPDRVVHMAPEIGGATELLAILADPIGAVQTPRLLNERLAAAGRNAVMVPMHVRRGDLDTVMRSMRVIHNLRGAVITMPHKTDVVALLDEQTPLTRQVGACNVVRRTSDGRLIGTILDGEAFVAALEEAGHSVQGRRVELLGAGGAASAIAIALARHGAGRITIRNRTPERAAALAERVGTAYPACVCDYGGLGESGAPFQAGEIVVNATSLGMRPGDPLPLDPAWLAPGVLAAEIIIVPEQTAFLEAAAARGCQVQRGRPMLLAQIALMAAFMFDDESLAR